MQVLKKLTAKLKRKDDKNAQREELSDSRAPSEASLETQEIPSPKASPSSFHSTSLFRRSQAYKSSSSSPVLSSHRSPKTLANSSSSSSSKFLREPSDSVLSSQPVPAAPEQSENRSEFEDEDRDDETLTEAEIASLSLEIPVGSVEDGIVEAQKHMKLITVQMDRLRVVNAKNCHIVNAEAYAKEAKLEEAIALDIKKQTSLLVIYLRQSQQGLEELTPDSATYRMLTLHMSTVRRFVLDTSNELGDFIQSNEDRKRRRIKCQILINNPELELPDDAPIENLQHQVFKQTLTSQHLQDLIAREDQIKEIHKSLLELKEIFIAFNEALALQEESIISIERSVEEAHLHCIEANAQLKIALKYRNKGRKKMALLIGLLGIGAGVVAATAAVKAGAVAALA